MARTLFVMAQPVLRIGSARAALDAARMLNTPSEVRHFESLAPQFAALRAFLETPEWVAIRVRIMGDGQRRITRPESLDDLARLFRWSADGVFHERPLPGDARAAYLHVALEIEAVGRHARQSLDDLALLFRRSAGGAFSERPLSADARAAYVQAAVEVEAFGRNARRVSPVSPAPAPQD